MRRIWLSVSTTFAAKAFAASLDFATLLITAHLLGPPGRGAIAATLAWSTLLATVFNMSLGQVGANRLMRRDPDGLRSTLSAVVVLGLVLSLISGLAGIVFEVSIGASIGPGLLAAALVITPLVIFDSYFSHLLSVSGCLPAYSAAQVIGRGVGFGTTLVGLFVLEGGVFAPLAGMFVALLTMAIIGGYALFRASGGLAQPGRTVMTSLLGDGVKLHFNTLGSFVIFQADVLLLGQLRPLEEAGWYQAAFQLMGLPILLPAVVTQVLYASMGQESPDKVWRTQRMLIGQVLVGLVLLACLEVLFAENIIRLLMGAQFLPAVPAFRILMLSMIGIGLSQLMVTQWIARGYFLMAGGFTLSLAVLSVALNLWLIPQFGFLASAWISAGIFFLVILWNVGMIVHIETTLAGRRHIDSQGSGCP